MMAVKSKVRSILKRHGGKNYLARRIITKFPEHSTYVEPFFGGGSVLLNKPRSDREIVGDIDLNLMNAWVALRDHPLDFATKLGMIDYTQENFDAAALTLDAPEHMSRAISHVVRNRMSRGGIGKDFAWSDRLRGGQPGDVNAWDTIRAEVPVIAERIRGVDMHCRDAVSLIESFDATGALIYCDPPYVHATRTYRAAYAHEMDDSAHRRLLGTLMECRGAVILSGYSTPLYEERLGGWARQEISMPNHSGQGKVKQRRIEVLWSNRDVIRR